MARQVAGSFTIAAVCRHTKNLATALRCLLYLEEARDDANPSERPLGAIERIRISRRLFVAATLRDKFEELAQGVDASTSDTWQDTGAIAT